MNSTLLRGDVAIVTGAGTGIGRAIAVALAEDGAKVLLTDLTSELCEATATTIARAGGQAISLPGDLNDQDLPEQLFSLGQRVFGSVSILVHCANPYHQQEDIFSFSEDALDEMVNVNIKAGIRFARLIGAHMRDERIKGRMIFVTSLHARTPHGTAHYSIAKAGLQMAMQEFAKALGPHGIRVNAIAPGIISANDFAAAGELAQDVPLRRIGRPEEVAQMAVSLLAERFSSYVSGTTVLVDGGLSLHNWRPG